MTEPEARPHPLVVAFRRRSRPGLTGDEELSARVEPLRDRRTRRMAAILVEDDTARMCFAQADARSRFELGSLTKGLTGMLLAIAVERGELGLQTPIGEILRETAKSPAGEVTLGELCTHTSGLPRLPLTPGTVLGGAALAWIGADPYHGITRERLLRDAARAPVRRPGEERYSNLGAALAGQAVARVGGQSFGKLLRSRLLDPLRMSSTDLGDAAQTVPWGRSPRGAPRMPWRLGAYAPAGGAVSTPADVGRLCRALVSGAAPGAASLQAVGTAPEGGRPHGMFWVRGPRPGLVWLAGATGGYSAFMALYPETGRAVAVLADDARSDERRRVAFALLA